MTDFVMFPATKRSKAFRKPLFGIGINDAPYITQPKIDGKNVFCPYFSVWRSMMIRCYSKKYHNKQPTYKECSVHEEWHKFMSFREWMEKQDWEGKFLDKDILIYGNKIYSEKTCFFVSRKVNNLMNDHKGERGKLPIGVCFFEGKYMAQCSGSNKRYLGLFESPKEAHNAWSVKKAEIIANIAINEKEPIKSALMKIASIIITPV